MTPYTERKERNTLLVNIIPTTKERIGAQEWAPPRSVTDSLYTLNTKKKKLKS